MVVIVPHPDIELKLVKAQKKMISLMSDGRGENIIYPSMPLWIKTPFESVEQAKKEIKSVTVLEPAYDEVQGCLVCAVEIENAGGDILKSNLDFISHCEEHSDVAIQSTEGTFPLPVKIFRLGECTSPKPGVFELSSTVWKKLTS